MNKIKVILYGLGTIGQEVAKALLTKQGIEIVGAVDTAPDKVGRDLGELIKANRKLNVTVVDNSDKLIETTYADVIVHATSARTLDAIYPEIVKPMKHGINIITPCMEASDPYLYSPATTARIDKIARENGISFLGIGSTQLADRIVLTLTEACTEINSIKLTAHADVSKFSAESRLDEFGIGLDHQEYLRRMAQGEIRGQDSLRKEAALIAERLGWKLDEVKARVEPSLENGLVSGISAIFEGIHKNTIKVICVYEFIIDPNHEYSHKVQVDGIPRISASVKYSPDRGIAGTVAPLVNAIPKVIKAKPGVLKMADLDICSRWDDVRTEL
jgi:hypothetical protein